MNRPKIAITLGDVAGIGPEVVARACADRQVRQWCRPLAVGNRRVLEVACRTAGIELKIEPIEDINAAEADDGTIGCYDPWKDEAATVSPGELDARAGRAAYEYLVSATRAALDDRIDAVVTAPLNKAALKAAGLDYPGHTEILADLCGVDDFAMMLYLPAGSGVAAEHGLGVAHVTLHTSIRSVPQLLTRTGIAGTAKLVAGFMGRMGCANPRVAVCALNPHAGEQGLFGDEEQTIIAPAVEAAQNAGVDATGPLPADTLLKRAVAGEFDGVVAMYHDQGHIALKLIGFEQAVNITLGLPIVRTSPSHGTAFDIAGTGQARPDGMIEAIRVASVLARQRRDNKLPAT